MGLCLLTGSAFSVLATKRLLALGWHSATLLVSNQQNAHAWNQSTVDQQNPLVSR